MRNLGEQTQHDRSTPGRESLSPPHAILTEHRRGPRLETGWKYQLACKPGSVWHRCKHRNVAAIHLGRRLHVASRNPPGWLARKPAVAPPCDGTRVIPIRSCSRWGLPCRCCYQKRGGLLPHPFTLTRPEPGGILSVALSLGSPPPDVIRHRVSVEPGLSSPYRLSTLVKRGCPANWSALL